MVPFGVSDDCGEQCVEAGDLQGGPLDFNPFSSIAAPLQTNGLWHCWAKQAHIFNRHTGVYRAALSRALEGRNKG